MRRSGEHATKASTPKLAGSRIPRKLEKETYYTCRGKAWLRQVPAAERDVRTRETAVAIRFAVLILRRQFSRNTLF